VEARPWSEYRLPGQLNLKLGAVILDFEFHLQMDLIGDVRDEPEVLPLDHDIIAGRKLVSDRVKARSRLLPGEGDLLLQPPSVPHESPLPGGRSPTPYPTLR